MKKPLILFCIIALALIFVTQIPDGKLHIFICDVGQGDGILITKGQTQLVIDAGPDNSIENCLGNHMPFWDRTIEVALMTHSDSDHSFGFSQMFERYKVDNFVANPVDSQTHSAEFTRLQEIVLKKKIHVTAATAEKEIIMNGINLKILFPSINKLSEDSTSNNNSKVLGTFDGVPNASCTVSLLRYRNFTGLFACDITPESERRLLTENVDVHSYLLKVPHHGSKTGLTSDFLKAVNPKVAVISVATKNRYGLPSPETIEMLNNFGVRTYRTDLMGEIEITTDGERVSTK